MFILRNGRINGRLRSIRCRSARGDPPYVLDYVDEGGVQRILDVVDAITFMSYIQEKNRIAGLKTDIYDRILLTAQFLNDLLEALEKCDQGRGDEFVVEKIAPPSLG